MAMICPRCGADNRDGARFCDECGLAFVRSGSSGRLQAVPSPLDDPLPAPDPHAATADLPEVPDGPLASDGAGDDALDAGGLPGSAAPVDTFYIGALDPDLADIPTAPAANTVTDAADGAAVPQPAEPAPSQTQEMPRLDEAVDAQSKAYLAPLGKKDRKASAPRVKRKGLFAAIIIAAVLALAAAIAFATYSLQLWGGKEVPNVIGMTAEDATVRLESAGFTVSQVLVKSDDVEGIVLRSSPEADRRAEAGSEVTIDVSCARTVPAVVGLSQDEALALLAEEGFENVQAAEQKSNEAPGIVIAVSPEAGVRSKAQAAIALTVAIPYVVPGVAGLPLEEAEAALIAEGYEPTTAYVYVEDVPEGTVLGTDPSEGTQLASGSEVRVNLAKSRGAEVEGFAQAWFGASSDYAINGMSYELKHVESLTYEGDDTCAFTVVMRPYETHSWFGSQPETRYGNEQRISGTMRFSQGGQLESIDPDIKRS